MACCTHRQELLVVGVVLRAQVEEGQDAGGAHVRDREARLGLGGERRALLARVLTQLREARLELQEPTCLQVRGAAGATMAVPKGKEKVPVAFMKRKAGGGQTVAGKVKNQVPVRVRRMVSLEVIEMMPTEVMQSAKRGDRCIAGRC